MHPTSDPSPATRDLAVRLAGLAVLMGIGLVGLDLPFFWDAITLGSQTARHFHEQGLGAWILPAHLDAGHPPVFGWYLALWWKAFGPSLAVSHLAMWPLLALAWWNYHRLLEILLPAPARPPAALLFFLEPTWLAQAVHVAPDVALLAFYLAAIRAALRERPVFLTLALLGLVATGLRGGLGAAALWFSLLAWRRMAGRPALARITLVPWLVAGCAAAGWFAFHFSSTGWLLANPDSPWGANQAFPGAGGMLRNLGLVGWRLIDFGRIGLWAAGAWWLVRKALRREDTSHEEGRLLVLAATPLVVYTLAFLPFANPIAHRYLLPVLVGALPWFAWRLARIAKPQLRRGLLAGACALLVSGHFWIYPPTVAQGWDASLAHLPYFGLREAVLREVDEPVWTEFPMHKAMRDTDPGRPGEFVRPRKIEGSWLDRPRVIWTNVINDIPDSAYRAISTEWIPEWVRRRGGVIVRVYRRPEEASAP